MIFSRRELPRRDRRGRVPDGQGRRSPRPIDKAVFPGVQGGPLMHVIAGKAVAFSSRSATSSARTSGGRSRTPRLLADDARRQRRPGRLGRHGQPPDARRRHAAGRDRQGGGAPPRRDRDHREQEPDPVRLATRRTPRPASGSGRLRRRRAASAPTRCARSRRSSPTRSRAATTPRPGRRSRPRCARSCRRFPVPGLPGRAPRRVTFDRRSRRRRLVPFARRASSSPRPSSRSSLTPVVRRLAIRRGVVDRPGRRRVNTSPVPRGGGVAVAVAFIVVGRGALVANAAFRFDARAASSVQPPTWSRCSLGGAVAAASA